MATYPSAIKTFTTVVDLADGVLAAHQNDRGGEITAIETELGVLPKGSDATVKARLDRIDAALISAAPIAGMLLGGKISVSVVSNDLVLAIKTTAGNDPSASEPVYVNINGTVRTITAATSCRLAEATNWFNAGSAELATKEIDYFAYAIWDSNSSVVAVAPARVSHGRVVSDFSATTTNEKYLGNYANYTTTDDVCVIGRFAATLSAGAGYTWTVPTFTGVNLIQHPIFETRWLSWTPTHSRSGTNYTNVPTQDAALYKILRNVVKINERHTQNGTPGGTNYQQFTLPFAATNVVPIQAANGTTAIGFLFYINAGTSLGTLYKSSDGTAEATASQTYVTAGEYDM